MARQFEDPQDHAERLAYLWSMVGPSSNLTPDEKEAFKIERRRDLYETLRHRLVPPPEAALSADQAAALKKHDPIAIPEMWDIICAVIESDSLDLIERSDLWLGYYKNFRLIIESDFFLIVMLLKSHGDPAQSQSAAEKFGQAWEGAIPKLAQFVVDGLPTTSDEKALGSALGNIANQGSYNAHFPEIRRYLRWLKEKQDLEVEIDSLESKNDRTEQEAMRLEQCHLTLRKLEGKLRPPKPLRAEMPAMTTHNENNYRKLDKIRVLLYKLKDEKQILVLQMRHFDDPPKTWEETAVALNCSVDEAKKIYRAAKAALRRLCEADNDYFFLG